MDKKKTGKALCLAVGVAALCLSFVHPGWDAVGLRSGCPLSARLIHPFFHANFLHAALNVWCLVSVTFIYCLSWKRLLLSYAAAVSVPVNLLSFLHAMTVPSVGLSGMVYFLFASVTFEVGRRIYWQVWMAAYLLAGLLLPGVNGWLHLWCYLLGIIYALLNKPIKVEKRK